jgi:hypothetical protein
MPNERNSFSERSKLEEVGAMKSIDRGIPAALGAGSLGQAFALGSLTKVLLWNSNFPFKGGSYDSQST